VSETSIVPTEREIVAPASPERVLADMKAFEWFKSKALTPSDYQSITGRNYSVTFSFMTAVTRSLGTKENCRNFATTITKPLELVLLEAASWDAV